MTFPNPSRHFESDHGSAFTLNFKTWLTRQSSCYSIRNSNSNFALSRSKLTAQNLVAHKESFLAPHTWLQVSKIIQDSSGKLYNVNVMPNKVALIAQYKINFWFVLIFLTTHLLRSVLWPKLDNVS